MERSKRLKAKKKKRLRKSAIFIILSFFAIIGLIIAYYSFQVINAANEAYDDLGREKSDLREEAVSIKEEPFSVLLMGIEDYSSGGKNGRTDALLVATVNPNEKTVKLLSIPRDSLVELVGKNKKDKITHAHVFGGKKMTIETVENLLDIPIDYYVAVNFETFENIIDIVGGVEVNVPFDFTQDTLDGKILKFKEGTMHLDGEHALAYARMRKQDPEGDIGRNKRQQEIIKGVLDNVFSVNKIGNLDDLINEVGRNVETNFKLSDALGLYNKFSNFSTDNLEQIQLETTSDRYNGASVQIVDINSLRDTQALLKQHLNLADSTTLSSKDDLDN